MGRIPKRDCATKTGYFVRLTGYRLVSGLHDWDRAHTRFASLHTPRQSARILASADRPFSDIWVGRDVPRAFGVPQGAVVSPLPLDKSYNPLQHDPLQISFDTDPLQISADVASVNLTPPVAPAPVPCRVACR